MTDDLQKQINKQTQEIKVLTKKLARSEANRAQSEKVKDDTDVLYNSVIKDLEATKEALADKKISC